MPLGFLKSLVVICSKVGPAEDRRPSLLMSQTRAPPVLQAMLTCSQFLRSPGSSPDLCTPGSFLPLCLGSSTSSWEAIPNHPTQSHHEDGLGHHLESLQSVLCIGFSLVFHFTAFSMPPSPTQPARGADLLRLAQSSPGQSLTCCTVGWRSVTAE